MLEILAIAAGAADLLVGLPAARMRGTDDWEVVAYLAPGHKRFITIENIILWREL